MISMKINILQFYSPPGIVYGVLLALTFVYFDYEIKFTMFKKTQLQ